MEHAGCCEEDHWLIRLEQSGIVWSNVGEVEHVSLDKGFLDFLIGPVDE